MKTLNEMALKGMELELKERVKSIPVDAWRVEDAIRIKNNNLKMIRQLNEAIKELRGLEK